MSLGENIRAARLRKGYTLNALATAAGINSGAVITNWELGINYPSFDNLLKVCYVLGTSPNELLEYESPSEDISTLDSEPDDEEYYNEKFIIDSYRSLSNRDKEKMLSIISAYTSSDIKRKDMPIKRMFLVEEEDPILYKKMKNKLPKLRKLRKSAHISFWALFSYLSSIGYTDLSLGYMWAIFDGMRIPSEELFSAIEDHLKNCGGKLT